MFEISMGYMRLIKKQTLFILEVTVTKDKIQWFLPGLWLYCSLELSLLPDSRIHSSVMVMF